MSENLERILTTIADVITGDAASVRFTDGTSAPRVHLDKCYLGHRVAVSRECTDNQEEDGPVISIDLVEQKADQGDIRVIFLKTVWGCGIATKSGREVSASLSLLVNSLGWKRPADIIPVRT